MSQFTTALQTPGSKSCAPFLWTPWFRERNPLLFSLMLLEVSVVSPSSLSRFLPLISALRSLRYVCVLCFHLFRYFHQFFGCSMSWLLHRPFWSCAEWGLLSRHAVGRRLQARCGAQAAGTLRAQAAGHTGSVAGARGLCCSVVLGLFLDQGLNLCLLHWQVGSQPLDFQETDSGLRVRAVHEAALISLPACLLAVVGRVHSIDLSSSSTITPSVSSTLLLSSPRQWLIDRSFQVYNFHLTISRNSISLL